MGLWQRFLSLFRANANDALSRAEDPERMLAQTILELRHRLLEAKKQVAVAIADEKRITQLHEQSQAEAAHWEQRALLALKAGDEELAREAVTRQEEHRQRAAEFHTHGEQQRAAVGHLKEGLRQLQARIEAAERNRHLLVARAKRAQAQKQIADTMSGLDGTEAQETFDRIRDRVEQLEAEAQASGEVQRELTGGTVEQRFHALEAPHEAVEQHLQALKERLRKAGELPAAERDS